MACSVFAAVFIHNVTYIYCAIISRVKCVVCKTTCVRCSSAFVALHWSGVGVGVFLIHLYFCMFLLSVFGAIAARF